MVPRLLVLALAFHRAPLRFPHLTNLAQPLPSAFGDWLAESAAALAPDRIQATASSLGSRPGELREAFLFFLRQILLPPGADHYRVLGLPRDATAASVKQNHGLMVRLFHPDRIAGEDERSTGLTARINAAYQTLRSARARETYDKGLPLVPSLSPAEELRFFQPRESLEKLAPPTKRRPILDNRSSRIAAAVLVPSALIVLLVFLMRPPPPMLLMNPGLASRSTTGPKYLKGGAADPVPASGVDSTNAPATQPTSGITLAAKAPREDSAVVTGLEDESGSAGERASDFGAKGAGDQAGQGLGLPLEAPVLPPGAEMVLTEAASETVESAAPRLESGETLKPRLQAEPGVREPTPQPQKPKPQPQPAEARAPSERANAEDAEPKVSSETASQSRSRAEKTDTDAKYRHASADRLVRRLARLFENADFRGLATLFTVTAKTSNGVGATAVREGYKELFGTALGRRMIVSNIRWWNGANRQLIGEGQLRVGTRSFPWADWRYRSGRIELELVPWMGSYKVSRMAHRFYE